MLKNLGRLASLALLAAAPVHASIYSGVVVFGDSLSDVGNVYAASGSALPNLGVTPEFLGTPFATPMTQLSLGFNGLIGPSLKAIPGALVIESQADKSAFPAWDSNPGLTIFHFQTNALFEDLIAHPANY